MFDGVFTATNMPAPPENKSHLVEHGMRYFMANTLRKCHKKQMEYNYLVNNLFYFGIFVAVFICLLLFKRSNRETTEQTERRKRDKETYLYTKMRVYNQQSRSVGEGMITDIPVW